MDGWSALLSRISARLTSSKVGPGPQPQPEQDTAFDSSWLSARRRHKLIMSCVQLVRSAARDPSCIGSHLDNRAVPFTRSYPPTARRNQTLTTQNAKMPSVAHVSNKGSPVLSCDSSLTYPESNGETGLTGERSAICSGDQVVKLASWRLGLGRGGTGRDASSVEEWTEVSCKLDERQQDGGGKLLSRVGVHTFLGEAGGRSAQPDRRPRL